ncbi:efflux transporter outer membrane subunit [Phenylobacterium sp.]|jgi:multidrug efflux system outer membrane protein|uniref:efflux transporter outer membrane subunit n=1 Tax=Phenylobacterium sp. TaxID=1871053 RepID=UPI002F408F83
MRGWPLLITLLLGGCNLAPTYERPAAPIYSAYSEPQAAGGRLATDVSWRNFFGDPQLKADIAAALQNNRDLAQATARIEQARAQYRIQNAQRLPQVDISASAAQARTPTPAGAVTSDLYTAQIGVTAFELDFWGRLANLSEAARRQYLATVEAQRAFELALIANVASVYYAIRSGEEGIDLSERTVVIRRHAQEIARQRLDAGVTSTVDFDQASVLVTQAETQLADLQRTTEQQRNLLLVLVGGPMAGPPPPGRGIADSGQFAALVPGLPSSLLVNRPDVLAAEEQLRGANANIGAARATYLPFIALTGSAGYISPELSSLFVGSSHAWSYAAAAALPLFDFGRRRALVAQTRARRDELVANYQRTVQEAFREVSDGLVGRRRLQEQIEAQERAVAVQRDLADTAELRYASGISVYLEVLDAERNLFTAEQQLILLRAAALQNGVALYIALGGGAA